MYHVTPIFYLDLYRLVFSQSLLSLDLIEDFLEHESKLAAQRRHDVGDMTGNEVMITILKNSVVKEVP